MICYKLLNTNWKSLFIGVKFHNLFSRHISNKIITCNNKEDIKNGLSMGGILMIWLMSVRFEIQQTNIHVKLSGIILKN